MRRTHQVLLATLLGASFGGTALAQGGPSDAQSIRPSVMLLVDTSGSMERLPDDGSNPSCDSCVPTCTGDTLIDRNNKTRWALTVEALTGTIQNYQCAAVDRSSYPSTEYDYGYYLPHIDFTQGMTQASDGILDSFATRVKFGLMTFDGVGTTLGGDTLIGFNRWFGGTDPGFVSAANGAPGMYSYGDVGRLAFPGCLIDYGINAGARGEGTFAGALVSIPRLDGVDDALAVNAEIQSSLTQVRPFGGTPIAGMLDDLRYYFEENTNVNAFDGTNGDPLFRCRKRIAILLTDGAPDAMFRDARFNCGIEEPPSGGTARVPQPALCTAANSHQVSGADPIMFPSTGCSCPYKKPETIAAELTLASSTTPALVTQLIVVAYNVHDPLALSGLEAIGAGAVREPADLINYSHVVQADGAGELRQELNELLNAAQPGVTSRSVPLSINVGDPVISGSSKRFDITAGFQIGRNTNEAWQGLLYRGRSVCQGTSVNDEPFSTAEGDVFHEVLTQQTAANQRVLLTAPPETYGPVDGTIVNEGYRPTVIRTGELYDSSRLTGARPINVRRPRTGDLSTSELSAPETITTVTPSQLLVTPISGNPLNVSNPNFVNSSLLNSRFFGDANRDGTPSTDADRAAIVDFTLGRGRPNALADIYHSQPVVMLPINRSNEARFSTIDARYTNWLRTMIATGTTAGHYDAGGRPGVVFVGTNDGILHAFNLDSWSSHGSTVGGGRELWGFIPPALFGKMASMIDAHQTGFDGSPQVKDVVLQRRAGEEPIFRSILVSAVRGAPAFIALDVTYPEEPVFLWQFSAPEVGNTVGNPGLTQVNVNWPGSGSQVRAVAILPGGEGVGCSGSSPTLQADWNLAEYPRPTTPTTPRNVRCWNRRGRALYVVDVATGSVIQEFGPGHFPSPLTGAVVVDSAGLSTSTAAYFFDHDGVLWRLSMMSADPQNWRVAPAFDMFRNLPAISSPSAVPDYARGRRPLYAPTLLRDKHGNLVIVAGTGDPDDLHDPAHNRVVSVTEKRGPLVNGEITAEMVLNWSIELPAESGVTGPLTLFQDAVYFGTYETTPDNLCGLGAGYMWGVHAYEAADPLAAEGSRTPAPRLMGSQAGPNDPYLDKELYTDNGLVIGATVKQQPICQSSTRSYNASTQQTVPTSAAGGGAFQLSGVMAGGSTGPSQVRAGDTGRGAVVQTTPRTIPVVSNTKVTSWASMFE